MSTVVELPLPPHYDPKLVVDDTRWLNYQQLLTDAEQWRQMHHLKAATTDRFKVGFFGIDIQNTFCHPRGELYVAGMSDTGGVDDSVRTVEWIYRQLAILSGIDCSFDTHRLYANFHCAALINDAGGHPAPFTIITHQDVVEGVWKASPFMASALGVSLMAAQKQLEHYTAALAARGRYAQTIWPFHGMLGGKGHALVSGLEEAIFFLCAARGIQPGWEVKGTNPWVEEYSVLGPEVKTLSDGTGIPRRTAFIEKLVKYDALVIAGQAKSHCVAWTIDDLLEEVFKLDRTLCSKVYLLEDCTTSIVVKDAQKNVIYDYGPDADAAFDKFRNAGMHVVRSTDPIASWPGLRL